MSAPQTSSTDSTSSLWCDADAVPYKRNQNLNFKWYVSWKIFRTRHPIRLSEVKRQKPSLVQQRNWFVRHHSFQQTMSDSFYRFTNFASVYREHILRQKISQKMHPNPFQWQVTENSTNLIVWVSWFFCVDLSIILVGNELLRCNLRRPYVIGWLIFMIC